MSFGRLTEQVQAYVSWKRDLTRELTRYRTWLKDSQLSSPEVEDRLDRGLKQLRNDHITIAFVGEFSRGKTELINALFFSQYGQRMLPSKAGRTTMCPTELFYDHHEQDSFLRLLPIETRNTEQSIDHFKSLPNDWVRLPLDTDAPEAMVRTLSEVSQVKKVTEQEAIDLGFDPETLERCVDERGMVMIPAWRHAMISLDHPLLKQGLRILDTPGLNALGSEPELTLSMLPSAQAIIFMLSADTGVTYSDLEIWEQYIQGFNTGENRTLYAVLNKIDVLWDDVEGEAHVEENISRVISSTAKHLNIDADNIFPLSAKQALFSKIYQNDELYAKSRVDELESLLSDRVIAQKERTMMNTVVNDMLQLLRSNKSGLNGRLESLQNHQQQLMESTQSNNELVAQLTNKAKAEHSFYHKQLLMLKSSKRLMDRQSETLLNSISHSLIEQRINEAREMMTDSWTTIGVGRGVTKFFADMDQDFTHLKEEVRRTNRTVQSIYGRYNKDSQMAYVSPSKLNIDQHLSALETLKEQSTRFRLSIKNIFANRSSVIRRFFNTLAMEVRKLHQRLHDEVALWAKDALLPLMQSTLENKQLLEHHLTRLKSLTQKGKDAKAKVKMINQYLNDTEQQIVVADRIMKHLRHPAPYTRAQKVVTLAGSASA